MTTAPSDVVRDLGASSVPRKPSFHELAATKMDFVFRILRSAGLDEASAEDATQQVFCVALRRFSDIELGKETSFLYATAMNVAADWRRRNLRRSEVPFEEDDERPDPASLDDLVEQRRARALLDNLLSNLPSKLRDVFVLSEIEEFTAPEIAACLDVPVGTVASRLARARKLIDHALSRLLSREGP